MQNDKYALNQGDRKRILFFFFLGFIQVLRPD